MALTNARARNLQPSETLAVKAKAAALKAQGRTIYDLSAGEPDIDTPEHIKAAAVEALKQGKTKYGNVSGNPELREAIAQKLSTENALPTKTEQVIVTNGGKQALYSLFQVSLEPGDEVIIPAPYWVSYPSMVELAGGKPVIVPTTAQNRFKITPAELKAHLTPKTRWVVVNSPSNPTGIGYTVNEMYALGAVIGESRAGVISDEVYEKLCFDSFAFHSFGAVCPELLDRTVTVNAFSKTYSMTGWRVGYAAGPKEIIDAMGRHQSQTTSNVCTIAQAAAFAALKGSHDFIRPMVESFRRRMNIAQEILSGSPLLSLAGEPDGAFYLFVRCEKLFATPGGAKLGGSAGLANALLETGGVAVVPGQAFGDDRAFRVSISSSDKNVEVGVTELVKAVTAIAG